MLQNTCAFIGRLCLSAIFILSALHKIAYWPDTENMVTNAIVETLSVFPSLDFLNPVVNTLQPSVILGIATGLELIGGLLIFLGWRVRLGATLLVIFLLPVTVVFHHFWTCEGPDRDLQMIMFLKNLSIFGGLLTVLALGKGQVKSSSQEGH